MHADPEFAGLGWAEVLDLTSLTQEEESGHDGPQGTCGIHVHAALGHSAVSAPCQARAGRHGMASRASMNRSASVWESNPEPWAYDRVRREESGKPRAKPFGRSVRPRVTAPDGVCDERPTGVDGPGSGSLPALRPPPSPTLCLSRATPLS